MTCIRTSWTGGVRLAATTRTADPRTSGLRRAAWRCSWTGTGSASRPISSSTASFMETAAKRVEGTGADQVIGALMVPAIPISTVSHVARFCRRISRRRSASPGCLRPRRPSKLGWRIGRDVWPQPFEALVLMLVLATGERPRRWGRAADVVQNVPWRRLAASRCSMCERRQSAEADCSRAPRRRIISAGNWSPDPSWGWLTVCTPAERRLNRTLLTPHGDG